MIEVFSYMDNAVTLKPITDLAFDYGKTQFEKANATLTDDGMLDMGVQDSSLGKNFGFYAFAIFGILLLIVIYHVIKWSAKQSTGLVHKMKV